MKVDLSQFMARKFIDVRMKQSRVLRNDKAMTDQLAKATKTQKPSSPPLPVK